MMRRRRQGRLLGDGKLLRVLGAVAELVSQRPWGRAYGHAVTHRAMWPVSWHLKHFFVDSSLGARQSRAKWFSPLQRLERCEQRYVSSHLMADGGGGGFTH
jgi:hypothetical protein